MFEFNRRERPHYLEIFAAMFGAGVDLYRAHVESKRDHGDIYAELMHFKDEARYLREENYRMREVLENIEIIDDTEEEGGEGEGECAANCDAECSTNCAVNCEEKCGNQ